MHFEVDRIKGNFISQMGEEEAKVCVCVCVCFTGRANLTYLKLPRVQLKDQEREESLLACKVLFFFYNYIGV